MRMKQIILASLLAAALALQAAAQTPPATATVPTTTTIVPAKPALVAPATVAPVTAAPLTVTPAVKPVAKPATVKPPVGPVNINTATPAELDALPGIGKARTKAIIAGRPYKSVDEIDSKKVIPHATFEKIKGQLTL